MASLEPAVKRIKYIINGEGKRVASPSTISGTRAGSALGGMVLSYQKVIGYELPGGRWVVDNRGDSPTTNRHVRALITALDELGIKWETLK